MHTCVRNERSSVIKTSFACRLTVCSAAEYGAAVRTSEEKWKGREEGRLKEGEGEVVEEVDEEEEDAEEEEKVEAVVVEEEKGEREG